MKKVYNLCPHGCFLQKRNLCFCALKQFNFVLNPLTSKSQSKRYCHRCLSVVLSTLKQRHTNEHTLINFYFHPNVNIEATFGNQFWHNVILSTLKQRGFVKVETMSIDIRRFNFHFQPYNNVARTLSHPRWNNAIFSKLF